MAAAMMHSVPSDDVHAAIGVVAANKMTATMLTANAAYDVLTAV